VGFGDITAASQSARLVVTAQMLLDLVALGLLVRAFVGAVQVARRQTPPADGQASPQGRHDSGPLAVGRCSCCQSPSTAPGEFPG